MVDGREFEADCVRRTLSGDTAAFRHLVVRYENRAFWTARGLLGNDDDARDVTQEAFLRAFRRLKSFDTERRFYTWFYRIVVNSAINEIRRRRSKGTVSLQEQSVPPDWHDEALPLERTETAECVTATLSALPADYRLA